MIVTHLLLLLFVACGASFFVWGHFQKSQHQSDHLRDFAAQYALRTGAQLERYRRGYRLIRPGQVLAFTPDVNAGAT